MKKRLCMLLIAALLLLLPHAASANAPIPWYIEISCENVEEGTQIEVVFQREDGTTRTEIADSMVQKPAAGQSKASVLVGVWDVSFHSASLSLYQERRRIHGGPDRSCDRSAARADAAL